MNKTQVTYKITHQGRDVGNGTIKDIYVPNGQRGYAFPKDDYVVKEVELAGSGTISKLKLRGPANTRYARIIRDNEVVFGGGSLRPEPDLNPLQPDSQTIASPFQQQIMRNAEAWAEIDSFIYRHPVGGPTPQNPNLPPAVIPDADMWSNRVEWGISPCEQGGADHCNYLTPVIHVGGNHPTVGQVSAFHANISSVSNILS